MESVTQWLDLLRSEDATAAQQALFHRYFDRLAAAARTRIPSSSRRAADEEDIALSTLNSFFRATQQGRYPDLCDRTGLWALLVRIAHCKTINHRTHQLAIKRGGGNVRGDSAIDAAPRMRFAGFDTLAATDPTPDSIVELRLTLADLFDKLEDDTLREVAHLRLSGHSNREIAQQLGCAQRTIERKLVRIRHYWLLISGIEE